MFNAEFYPTPRSVARKMLEKISEDAVNFLDPSAGKGDIAEVIKGNEYDRRYSRRNVDCIEIDPELAHIITGKDFPLVGYDWLTYEGVSYYDAILMNPPFSNGDEHLLKAWDFIHNGEIVCLLNEETVNNPYTKDRQRLAGVIREHGSVEYLGDCFSTAQRKTDVRVAMVYLRKVAEDDRAELWGVKTEEKPVGDDIGPEDAMLALKDDLGNMQHYYDMATAEIFKAFAHVRKAAVYLEANGISTGHGSDGYASVLSTALGNMHTARAEFARKHRKDAWEKVFDRMQFHKWLDKQQRESLLRDVAREMHLPFTKENIQGTLDNIFSQRKRLFEQSVANVFDELVSHFKGNAASEGWKTNDSFKVNQKLIFPYGCEWDNIFNRFSLRYGRNSIDIYNDLDRVLCVLSNQSFEDCLTIGKALDCTFKDMPRGETRPNTTQSQFFKIRFFKKGTVHLEFLDAKLWEQFNRTAAAGKKWLGQNTNDRNEFPGRRPEYRGARKGGGEPVSQAASAARMAEDCGEDVPVWALALATNRECIEITPEPEAIAMEVPAMIGTSGDLFAGLE